MMALTQYFANALHQQFEPVNNLQQNILAEDIPDEIIPGLFLGNTYSRNPSILDALKITNVVTTNGEPLLKDAVKYKNIGVMWSDYPGQNLFPEILTLIKFMHKQLDSGEKVLVHCHQGVSRSASVVIFYLMYYYNMTYEEAYNYVKTIRPIVNPNPGFVKQLKEQKCG